MATKKKIYIYVGGGLGIPGLPHQVTKQWCQADGLFASEQLEAALKNGTYRAMKPSDQIGQGPTDQEESAEPADDKKEGED